jgi:hypothetical protein
VNPPNEPTTAGRADTTGVPSGENPLHPLILPDNKVIPNKIMASSIPRIHQPSSCAGRSMDMKEEQKGWLAQRQDD